MIVGGYVMHLYCVNGIVSKGAEASCIAPATWQQFEGHGAEFGGRNEREAKAWARAADWVFRKNDVLCPFCAKNRDK